MDHLQDPALTRAVRGLTAPFRARGPASVTVGGPDEYGGRRGDPPRSPTRTATSSDDDNGIGEKPSRGEVIGLVVGLIGVLSVGAAALVRWRTGRALRQPDQTEALSIARPLGRIAHRVADFGWLGPNVVDAIKAATATGAYLNNGPLLQGPAGVDPGQIPDQEDQF